MRSCLIQLLVMVAAVFALLWFGLPFGAGWLATNALNAAGFTGTDTRVVVSSDLPPSILLGHADTIRLTSSQVSVGDLHAATDRREPGQRGADRAQDRQRPGHPDRCPRARSQRRSGDNRHGRDRRG
jgi:hypothetical protein